MGTLENSEDPDEMPHDVAFHQGLHCLQRQCQSSKKVLQYFWEIITGDPSIYTVDHTDFIVCSYIENLVSLKRVRSLHEIIVNATTLTQEQMLLKGSMYIKSMIIPKVH